jgi:hypothetical protein
MGLEFREGHNVLGPKNTAPVKAGQVRAGRALFSARRRRCRFFAERPATLASSPEQAP